MSVDHLEEHVDACPLKMEEKLPNHSIHSLHGTGLVTKIFHVRRRLFNVPLAGYMLSHTAMVIETSRRFAFLLEFVCGGLPVLIHNVTSSWSFSPTRYWNYGSFKWKRGKRGRIIPRPNFSATWLARLTQASADQRGIYGLTANNCHQAIDHVLLTLRLALPRQLLYGSRLWVMPLDWDPHGDLPMPIVQV
eukprot:gnl/Dysnectes_brevis/3706_a4747_1265.p1 GENE.gnl/Dysnectes_brevis/3706_a4747_1265~~gnl/Dysnectes_brevis/3706_a4747_1265.p1  ORF type:complete len:191 (+),score=11.87 gnl/Dysnectes_brevis/3706_a4747_1265:42-614(+)